MDQGSRSAEDAPAREADHVTPRAWQEFIRFCRELGHGEIERLYIQDGVPVLAETARKKVKFARDRG